MNKDIRLFTDSSETSSNNANFTAMQEEQRKKSLPLKR